MRVLVNSEQMKNFESFLIAERKITDLDLMNRAAQNMLTRLESEPDFQLHKFKRIFLLAGSGNNAGDGYEFVYLLLGKYQKLNLTVIFDEANSRLCRLKKSQLENTKIVNWIPRSKSLAIEFQDSDLVIDAVYGFGFKLRLEDSPWESIFKKINKSNAEVISLDIPSGVSANNSESLIHCLRAKKTLMLLPLKIGPLASENRAHLGKILPVKLDDTVVSLRTFSKNKLFTLSDALKLLPRSENFSAHKLSRGTSLLIAGSESMWGAAALCTEALYRMGSGYVMVKTESDFATLPAECIKFSLASPLTDLPKSPQVAVIGPGLFINSENELVIYNQIINLKKQKIPILLDAGALRKDWIEWLDENDIITPHFGEFKKIFPELKNLDRIDSLDTLRGKIKPTILLKGYRTLILSKQEIFVINSGNPVLAKAGSGDILSGMIGALMARGYKSASAACLGAYLHGYLGDRYISFFKNDFTLMASDLYRLLPKTILHLKRMKNERV